MGISEYLPPIIICAIVSGFIFGIATNVIGDKKGYDTCFLWGFFLGIIGLIIILLRPNKDTSNNNENLITSEADELAKFKKLLDEGAITEEEYQAKKKQILKL